MNFDRDPTNTDEYFVTALQIFDCCGVESSGFLRVDALMDRFAPFVKTNKAEISFLKSLLDPEQTNPDINVTKLAKALHKYSENQKTKVDLDESFNFKTGQAPQDSDSGISSDGLQLLEELQCELKEKEHLTHQLRNQLDFTDRQHEEALAALTAERDSLLRHLNLVRDENATLSHVRRDHDEACERLCASETALAEAKRELDTLKKHARVYQEQVAVLEIDKLTLQELLSKSKDECHRINEMYAARQSALLEENETFKTENAELSSRFQDQDEFLQQVLKEKVLLEMELKDMLNKSNQTHLRLDRSIDVSYTEDQMLTALDSLNADSRFGQEHRLLDEESFSNALKEDQGRSTNISLFDEIRFSISNMSRLNLSELNLDKYLDSSLLNYSSVSQTDEMELHDKAASTQTEDTILHEHKTSSFDIDKPVGDKNLNAPISAETPKTFVAVETQTEPEPKHGGNSKVTENCTDITIDKYEKITRAVETQTNLNLNDKTASSQTEDTILHKDEIAGFAIDKPVRDESQIASMIDKTPIKLVTVESQTEPETKPGDDGKITDYCTDITVTDKLEKTATTVETQTDVGENPLLANNNKLENNSELVSTGTQTLGALIKRTCVNRVKFPYPRPKMMKKTVETQTENEILSINNNSYGSKCFECEMTSRYNAKLERDVKYSNLVVSEVQSEITKYEENLIFLQKLIDEGNDKNRVLQCVVKDLNAKIEILEAASEMQRDVINKMLQPDVCCVDCQTECDQSSVSTQVEVPCVECEKRNAVAPHRNLRRFFWDPLKCLFQIFAVLCFLGAVCVLCGVVRSGAGAGVGGCRAAPWRWLHAQDLMDLLLRIEYTTEVPM